MPKELPQYGIVISSLDPVLKPRGGKLISIDGRPGAGKSTLARFLGWHFEVPVIHTDLFLTDAQQCFEYRLEELARVVGSRLCRENPKPVIVEGVVMLRVLRDLGLQPSFSIRMTDGSWDDGREWLITELDAYERDFSLRGPMSISIEVGVSDK